MVNFLHRKRGKEAIESSGSSPSLRGTLPCAKGQRGRIAKSDAHHLHERPAKHENAVLRFPHGPEVSFARRCRRAPTADVDSENEGDGLLSDASQR